MQRVERHIILNNREMDNLCFLSKNLYNVCNFYIRRRFIQSQRFLSSYSLIKILTRVKQVDYKNLPAQTSQQVILLLEKNWKSFFKANKEYAKNKSKFISRPKLPKYKHKSNGKNIIVFTNQQIKLNGEFIHFPKMVKLEAIKTKVNNIKQIRIVPRATCYIVEVVYDKKARDVVLKPDTYLSIDLGVNNFATCVNNIGLVPFIINGRPLKSFNQYFNKKKAKLMSFVGDIGFSNNISRLTHKRNMKICDYLHKTSKFIINYCVEHNISTIVVGKNKNWKTCINIGKKSNQNFVNIPFDMMIKQLQYKSEEVGINVKCNEESYTSKCSFLDLEPIKKHAKYLGRRVKRGLFKSSKGLMINADVNGAFNILRKAVPNLFNKDGIEGIGLCPIIINI